MCTYLGQAVHMDFVSPKIASGQFARVVKGGGLKIHWRQLRVGSSPTVDMVVWPQRNRSTVSAVD